MRVEGDDILLLIHLARNPMSVILPGRAEERTAGMRGRETKGKRFARKITLLPGEGRKEGRISGRSILKTVAGTVVEQFCPELLPSRFEGHFTI